MDKENYHDYGNAPLKAEGMSVDYEYRPRSPQEQLEYYKGQVAELREIQSRYRRIARLARQGQLMIASKEGFTLVEDLDEYVHKISSVTPVTRKELIQEGLNQLGKAFDESYKVDPNVEYKWVKP